MEFFEISVMPFSGLSTSRILKLRHIIGVLLAMLILSGCSAVRLAYNNAPELGYWWLDGYLDFNSVQSARLRADLSALQVWHRQSELPLVLATLVKTETMAAGNVSASQVCAISDELRPRLQALLDRAEPSVLALTPTFSTAQLNHLAQQFEKRSEKWREEWLSGTAAERRERRARQLVERIESFYGPLDNAQRALLQSAVADSVFDPALNHREVLRRQQDTLQTLQGLQGGKADERKLRQDMRALVERAMASPDADYRKYAARLQLETCGTLAALHNSSTPAQRLQLTETLRDYAGDVRALMTSTR